MRWPWRRRGGAGRVVFIGSSPFDVAQALRAVPTPSPVVAAWVPEPAPTPAPVPVPPAPRAEAPAPDAEAPAPPVTAPPAPADPDNRVQLGFADGSVLTLDDDDPRAVALRAAAARLTGGS